jgi:stress-induced-phosphoprotein 1
MMALFFFLFFFCFYLQNIMSDPVMQSILQQAQGNPAALQDHMKNPVVRQKVNKLISAGIIRTR